MSDLSDKKCIPCEGGIPAFDIGEIHKYLKKVNGWHVSENDEKNFFIQKEFKFKYKFKNSNLLVILKFSNYNKLLISGHSSVVERLVANEKVVGSSPIARSN